MIAVPLVTVFEDGPLRGRRLLGRIRQTPAQPSDPVAADLPADEVIRCGSLCGEYMLVRVTGGEHIYTWRDDVKADAA